MRVRIVDAKAWYAGLAYACIGIVAFVMSHQYPIGTPLRMGPGYFPALMGVVLFGLGVVSAAQGLRPEHPNPDRTATASPRSSCCSSAWSPSVSSSNAPGWSLPTPR